MQTVDVAVHGQLEIVVRFGPLAVAWVQGVGVVMIRERERGRTLSTRERRPSPVLISAARLRGPYWRVSWRPRVPAVSWTEADLGWRAGTMR